MDVYLPERPYVPLKIFFGAPNPDQILGRDEDVQVFWNVIQSGSIRLIAERRMGKTWLLRRALAQNPSWATAFFLDVEGYKNVPEFVRELNKALHEQGLVDSNWWQGAQDWFRRTISRIGSTESHGAKLDDLDPWPGFLRDTCRRIALRDGSSRVVFIFDEFPSFLDSLMKSDRTNEAAQLLDVLRALRQENPSLRMVYCGSLGLHVVLDRLREWGYSGRPVNDMPPHEVTPLTEDWARYLAACLLSGEAVPCDDLDDCAQAVARAACNVPFYIQHMVKWMKKQETGRPWTARSIRKIPEEATRSAGDPFELAYYDERIDVYYKDLDFLAERARIALDLLSREPKGLPFNVVLNLVRHHPKTLTLDPEGLLEVLRTLREDHYLVEEHDRWRFKLEIVRRTWEIRRGEHGL